ncbi:MAG: hypothetical protein ACTHOL_03715 [Luteibacter jiangsuensis]
MDAMVFTVLACGFRPRSALEAGNSGDVRVDKIMRIIQECSYSVHDLSAVELDAINLLPRFNMPFELGLAIGLKKGAQSRHSFLVLERDRFTSQRCLSDIAGQDLQAHGGSAVNVIRSVRNWLLTESRRKSIPGPNLVIAAYENFQLALPEICDSAGLDIGELPFVERVGLAKTWLKQAA